MSSSVPFLDRNAPGPLLGVQIVYPSVSILERVALDWDWVWIDAQHGDLDLRETLELIRTANQFGLPSLVRIASHDATWAARALEGGAAGIIVPMVESVAEARAMVCATKFPPTGNRSYGGRRIIDKSGRGYYKTANADTALILQLESPTAVAQAGALAAIDGVDGLFFGPDDFAIREGADVEVPRSRGTLEGAMEAVAEPCRRLGKWSVCIGVGELAMELAKNCGYRLVVGGGPASFIAQGSKAASERLRKHFRGSSSAAASGMAPGLY